GWIPRADNAAIELGMRGWIALLPRNMPNRGHRMTFPGAERAKDLGNERFTIVPMGKARAGPRLEGREPDGQPLDCRGRHEPEPQRLDGPQPDLARIRRLLPLPAGAPVHRLETPPHRRGRLDHPKVCSGDRDLDAVLLQADAGLPVLRPEHDRRAELRVNTGSHRYRCGHQTSFSSSACIPAGWDTATPSAPRRYVQVRLTISRRALAVESSWLTS